jgi:POT family proton-dependent oligopeptide transporter
LSATSATTAPQGKTFLGHPRGLSTLFFTEMWERLSYYGMKAILFLYMSREILQGGLAIDPGLAKALVAVYGAAIYMSGIVGGWLADRLLGSRRAVLYGGVLIMLGHIALALPLGEGALFASMILLVLGTGLLKPNISNMVGGLYAEDDRRRDAGFSVFYMGVNLGAVIGIYGVGAVGEKVNFHAGFSIAAVGMAVGLIQYVIGKRNLPVNGELPTNPVTLQERSRLGVRVGGGLVAFAVLLAALALTGVLSIQLVIDAISVLSVTLPVVYFVWMYRSERTTGVERSRLLAYVPLFVASMFFWFVQEQGSSTLVEYTDKRVGGMDLFGWTIPVSWFQSINPVVIIGGAPLFALMWMKLGKHQPTTPRKFAIGLLFGGASFLAIIVPHLTASPDARVGAGWLALSYLLVTIGELFLSPVGLSATTKLAPKAFAAQTMGLWFMSNAAAQGVTAQVVPFYTPGAEVRYFGLGGLAVVAVGVLIWVLSPAIHRKMAGVD